MHSSPPNADINLRPLYMNSEANGSRINLYPSVDEVARQDGIASNYLIEIFELEKQFHRTILDTEEPADRKRQYSALYNEVHRLKQAGWTSLVSDASNHARLVRTFSRELRGKSVLDVGCGTGLFLQELARSLPHGDLCGLDTSAVHLPGGGSQICFIQSDIISFQVHRPFEVVFSHQVLEHIAPADLPAHLRSIYSALKPGGTFIVCLPNRFWGPQDITRIIDNSFQGKVPAMGSHLNESSYCELLPVLAGFGFKNFRTVLPLGAFLPLLRHVRVQPGFNQFVELNQLARNALNLVRVGGRPIFKNPIMLTCRK